MTNQLSAILGLPEMNEEDFERLLIELNKPYLATSSQGGPLNGFYGRKHSEETKQRWSKKRNGQRRSIPISEERKNKLKDAVKRSWQQNYVSRKAAAVEALTAARLTIIGKPRSNETKQKLSAALKGKSRPWSAERKRNFRSRYTGLRITLPTGEFEVITSVPEFFQKHNIPEATFYRRVGNGLSPFISRKSPTKATSKEHL